MSYKRRMLPTYGDANRTISNASPQDIRILKGHTGGVTGMAFSPDSRRLTSAGFDSTVRIWDTANGQETLTLTGHPFNTYSVAFGLGGRRLPSARRLHEAIPASLAFLAMTHHQLGEEEQAHAVLARLREISKQTEWAKDQEVQGLLREVETVVDSRPAVPKE
jgi:hypothetical protein